MKGNITKLIQINHYINYSIIIFQVSIPFFSFPKSLDRDKKKVREWEAQLEAIRMRRKKRKAAMKSQIFGQSKETRHKRNPSTSSMPAMPTPHRHATSSTSMTTSVSCHKRNPSSASWCVMLSQQKSSHQPVSVNKRVLHTLPKQEHNISNISCASENQIESGKNNKSVPIDYGKSIKGNPKLQLNFL